MLILTRKPGESFWIGEETEITFLGAEGNAVKIGVRAPRHIVVLRTELRDTEQQNRAAAGAAPESRLDGLAATLRLAQRRP
jgi:carbon storage regulator